MNRRAMTGLPRASTELYHSRNYADGTINLPGVWRVALDTSAERDVSHDCRRDKRRFSDLVFGVYIIGQSCVRTSARRQRVEITRPRVKRESHLAGNVPGEVGRR